MGFLKGLGKVAGSLSPAFGLLSGSGLFGSSAFKGALGSMSPLYGAASGNGLFGQLMQSLMGKGQEQAGPDFAAQDAVMPPQPQQNPGFAEQGPYGQAGPPRGIRPIGAPSGLSGHSNMARSEYLDELLRGFSGPR